MKGRHSLPAFIMLGIIAFSSCDVKVNRLNYEQLIADSIENARIEDSLNQVRVQDSIMKVRKDSIKRAQDSLNVVKIAELKKSFNIKKDEFSDITWYTHRTTTTYRNSNDFYFYFGKNDNGLLPLRMVLQYHSDDWLFIRNLVFNIDGKTFSYVPFNVERDNKDGYIWEWFDEVLGSEEYNLSKKLAEAKTVKIKLNGQQYYDVKTLTARQLKALKETFELYYLLKQK